MSLNKITDPPPQSPPMSVMVIPEKNDAGQYVLNIMVGYEGLSCAVRIPEPMALAFGEGLLREIRAGLAHVKKDRRGALSELTLPPHL